MERMSEHLELQVGTTVLLKRPMVHRGIALEPGVSDPARVVALDTHGVTFQFQGGVRVPVEHRRVPAVVRLAQ